MSAAPVSRAEQAADWFALKRSGAMSAAQLLEFQAWCDADAQNREAFEEAEQSWLMAGALRFDPYLKLMRERARRTFPRFPRAAAAGLAAGALMVAGVSGWAAVKSGVLDDLALLAKPREQSFLTGIGQRTTVTLADGSIVTLDTDTALRTRESGGNRLIFLERGRAFFRVVKDKSRPFIVTASDKTVTATGTAFDVRVEGDKFAVTLVEGRVRVEQPRDKDKHAADMRAGWRLTAVGDEEWKIAPADIGKETGWLEGRLTFINDPLSEVVAELNRYSDQKIVLADASVGQAPVVAVLKPGDLDSFVRMVKSYKLARVRETEVSIELTAR